MEHKGDNYTNCEWCFWHSNLRVIKGPRGLGSWWTSGDYPNDSIIENSQNTEESPGYLRRLAVTQTPVKNHQLILMGKTLKEQTLTKGLLKGLEDLEVGGRVETIQTTALLRTARIQRRVLET